MLPVQLHNNVPSYRLNHVLELQLDHQLSIDPRPYCMFILLCMGHADLCYMGGHWMVGLFPGDISDGRPILVY